MELYPINKHDIFETDNDVADHIYNILKDDITYCNNQIFIKKDHIWHNDAKFIQDYLLRYVTTLDIYKTCGKESKRYWADTLKGVNVVKAILVIIRLNPNIDLYRFFHSTTKGRLCFIDGVLHFKVKHFYKWDDVDFPYYSTI